MEYNPSTAEVLTQNEQLDRNRKGGVEFTNPLSARTLSVSIGRITMKDSRTVLV